MTAFLVSMLRDTASNILRSNSPIPSARETASCGIFTVMNRSLSKEMRSFISVLFIAFISVIAILPSSSEQDGESMGEVATPPCAASVSSVGDGAK